MDGPKLAKVLGLAVIISSAISQVYGASINYITVNSLGVYPGVEYLVPLAMFVTGLLLIPKIFLYMRFSRFMPKAGATYVWTSRSLGVGLGFIVNFVWWIGITASMGFLAFAFVTFLAQALIQMGVAGGAFLLTPAGHMLVGTLAIWVIFALHYSGVGNYGTFVKIMLGFVLLAALVTIIYGFGTSPDHYLKMLSGITGKSFVYSNQFGPPSFSSFLALCTIFLFSYGGLSAAPTLSGETKDAGKNMPKGILYAWIISVVMYTLVTWSVFHVAPWWASILLIKYKQSGLATVPGIIGVLAPRWIGVTVSLIVALLSGKCLAPEMMSSSRFIFAWAQDKVFPEAFTRTTASKSPYMALILTAILANLFLIESSLKGWAIGVVVRSVSVLLVLLFVSIGALNLKYNKRFAGVDWAENVARGSGIVVASVSAIIISLVLMESVIVVPKTALFFQPVFQLVVGLIIGTGIWFWFKGKAEKLHFDIKSIERTLPVD
ncbi:MAG TPA: APC family permease [Spirochaetia bacterium]|nr:APC family permease [Spirochaetia bacterium]